MYKSEGGKLPLRGQHMIKLGRVAAALATAFAAAGPVQAFEIDTGNEDLVVRWDNTVRYNLGFRAQSQNSDILKNVNTDDGDRNFKNGSIVANRLDVVTELDVVWQGKYGARLSAAGWYDQAYSNLDGNSAATSNTLRNGFPVAGELSGYADRYHRGVSGELLDYFVFGTFDLGETPVSLKVGQHTVYWGEGLYLGGVVHGITYAQTGVDLLKGQAAPGTEAKELFRPRGAITISAQPASDLTLAGQWFWGWQGARANESGSYLQGNDALLFGSNSVILGANPFFGRVPGSPQYGRVWTDNGDAVRNDASLGDWGLSARWSPEWLDGTLGFYYRNTTDILPQQLVTPGFAAVPNAACPAAARVAPASATTTLCNINPRAATTSELQRYGKQGTFQYAWGGDIDIFGVSLGKNIGGVSVGAEVSYRRNMPLLSDPITVLPAALIPPTNPTGAIATTAVPEFGDTPGAKGNTWHGLVNGIATFGRTPLWDASTLAGEVVWMYLDSVTQNEAVYKGRSAYSGIDKPSSWFVGMTMAFTPTWFQVFPGVDLTMPLTWTQGLNGTAAVAFGGNENAGSFSAGLGATIYQKYLVNLAYNGYFGDYLSGAGGAATTYAGPNAQISDRGWVSLTFKTTF